MLIPFKKSLRDFRGFTLVELLVVIGIISILATILLLQLGTARAKARDAKRIADVNQTRSAVEQFFDDNGTYPTGNDLGAVPNKLFPKYLSSVPKDPLTPGCANIYSGNGCYGYAVNALAAAVKYQIWAELEVSNRAALSTDTDINATAGGDWTPAAGVGINGGAANETCVNTAINSNATNDCLFDLGTI